MVRITVYRIERAPSQQGISAPQLIEEANRMLVDAGCDLFGRDRNSVPYHQVVFEFSMTNGAYCSRRRK